MLTIEECRKHIDGHEEYSDEEIRKVRDACHGFSRLILNSLRDKIRNMKQLKFKSHLIEKILDGNKTVTWRLFDDKDLKVGDWIKFINSDTGEVFAKAEITEVKEKTLGQIKDSDYVDHIKFKNQEDMVKHYKNLYGEKVTLDMVVKMVKFKLIK